MQLGTPVCSCSGFAAARGQDPDGSILRLATDVATHLVRDPDACSTPGAKFRRLSDVEGPRTCVLETQVDFIDVVDDVVDGGRERAGSIALIRQVNTMLCRIR